MQEYTALRPSGTVPSGRVPSGTVPHGRNGLCIMCTMMHRYGIWRAYPFPMSTLEYTSHRALFAYELKRLRTEQNLSQSRFSVMVGISRRHLIKLEAGQASPTLEMMERLAAGLGVAVRDMVDFEAIGRRVATESAGAATSHEVHTEYDGGQGNPL